MKSPVHIVVLVALLLAPALAMAESSSVGTEASTPLLQALEGATCGQSVVEQGIPKPMWKTCTADLDCPDGCTTLHCVGNTTCVVGSTSVTCDGVATNCPYPACSPPQFCPNKCDYCECVALGIPIFNCVRAYCSW